MASLPHPSLAVWTAEVQSAQDPDSLLAGLPAWLAELRSQVTELPNASAAGLHAEAVEAAVSLFHALKEKADEWTRADIQRGQRLAAGMVTLAEAEGLDLPRAVGLLALGNAHAIGLGEYREAVTCYQTAAAIYRANGREVEAAQSQIGNIYALANLGRYAEGLADGEAALAVLEAHQQWLLAGRMMVNLAILLGRQGQDSEALALLERASAAYRRLGNTAEVYWLRVDLNRALLLRNLGRFDEANAASRLVMEAHQRAGRAVEAARAMQSLGVTHFMQGRYNDALELLEKARAVFLDDGRKRYAVLVELFLSDCLLQLRRFPEVLEKCRQVRAVFSELGTRYEVGQAILNEASAYTSLGRYEEALESLSEARRLFEEEGNQPAVADADLQRASLLLVRGESAESLALALDCAQVFAGLDLPVKAARARLAAARAALAQGSAAQARALALNALDAGQALLMPDLTYPSRHLLGHVALGEGAFEEGLRAFEQAIDDLERLRGRMMVEFRAGFMEDKGRLYEDAVELCLSMDQAERGLEFCERAKSRALLDLLSHRVDLTLRAYDPADQPLVDELERLRAERDHLYRRREGGEGFGLRGADGSLSEDISEEARVLAVEKRITELWHSLLVRSAAYARDAALWQVRVEPAQPYLGQGSRLVEYFAVRGRLVAFLVSPVGIEGCWLPGDLAQVQRLIQLFWLNLKSVPLTAPAHRAGLAANLRGVLKRLYDLLLAPLAGRLDAAERLIIVPHGPLHYLPFQALFDGQSHLIERWPISYLPGASMLRYCRDTRPTNRTLLAVGHSYGGKLPFTLSEAQLVAARWQGRTLLESQATLSELRREAPRAGILHLAAHGVFRDDNPLFSGLALEDGWLTTLDVFNLRLDAALVTLSACQTGRSVLGGGDELLGLMRSFLSAGAASLITTLWMVEDRSTAALMEVFYSALLAGAAKGDALRQAQLALLKGEETAFAHPFFWASFCLVGDEGPL